MLSYLCRFFVSEIYDLNWYYVLEVGIIYFESEQKPHSFRVLQDKTVWIQSTNLDFLLLLGYLMKLNNYRRFCYYGKVVVKGKY